MQKHILIIEDEQSIQNILKAFLEDAGYNITSHWLMTVWLE